MGKNSEKKKLRKARNKIFNKFMSMSHTELEAYLKETNTGEVSGDLEDMKIIYN